MDNKFSIGTFSSTKGTPYEMWLKNDRIYYNNGKAYGQIETTIKAAIQGWREIGVWPDLCDTLEKWLEIKGEKGEEDWKLLTNS